MGRTLRTAVAAAATAAMRDALPGLLAGAGVELIRLDADGADAWESLMRLRPDLLVADAELPRLDGAALVDRALRSMELPVRPAAVLLRWPEFALPAHGELKRLGAEVVDKPVRLPALRTTVERLRQSPPAFPPEELDRASALLDALGVPAHPGRECLKYASLICASDEGARYALGSRVYPVAGELAGLSASQAERAMRHAIGRAWQSDKFENQYRIFADTVDAARGQPTCGEMISRLADILRSEG